MSLVMAINMAMVYIIGFKAINMAKGYIKVVN